MIHKTTITGGCPGGFCDYIQHYSEFLIVALCVDIFIFFVTLVPPLFNWSNKKPDGKKRIYFATLACITFYFWLTFLAINTIYCFGFLANEGPCIGHVKFASLGQDAVDNETSIANNITIDAVDDAPLLASDIDETQGGKPDENVEALASSTYNIADPTTSRSKRHTESSLEPPTSVPPSAFSSYHVLSLSAFPSSAPSSPSLLRGRSSFPSSVSRPNDISRDTAAAYNIEQRHRNSSSNLPYPYSSRLFSSSSSAYHSKPSSPPSSLTPSAGFPYLFTPSKHTTQIEENEDEFEDDSDHHYDHQHDYSSYGILAQALVSSNSVTSSTEADDCITAATEVPEPTEHEEELKNLTLINILICVTLFVVLIANAKEGKHKNVFNNNNCNNSANTASI